ncbi:MAG: sulfatase-like hydrolase/transferase [Planctomycetota bacterium]
MVVVPSERNGTEENVSMMAHAWICLITTLAAAGSPNVLVIVADDLGADRIGCGGESLVRTPNIDRLAAEGTWFQHAYANSPVCTASRQSFLTGRLPQEVGVTRLTTALGEGTVTLAELMRQAGYRTATFGKMHFNSKLPHGFDVQVDRPDHERWLKKNPRAPLPTGIQVLPPWRPFKDPASVWLNSQVLPYPSRDAEMTSTWLVEQAEEYLNRTDDRPFFVMVSLTEPHSPFHFPIEFRGRISPASMHVPEVTAADEEQIPEIFRALTDQEKQGIRAAYLTSVEFLDLNVGRLMNALSASPHANNTLVVFLGDHGYMLGEHGRFEKHCFFEPAVRAPLILRIPGQAQASTSDALVEFIDLAPTVLDYCHLPSSSTFTGKSLMPIVRREPGADARHRDAVFSLYTENEEAMIRDRKYKFVYSTGERRRKDGYDTGRSLPGESMTLFDMTADPGEKRNLAGDPESKAIIERFERILYDRLVPTHFRREEMPMGLSRRDAIRWCLVPRDGTDPVAGKRKESALEK